MFLVRRRQPLSDIAERRRRDPRAHPERQARQLGMRKAGSVCRRAQRPRTYIFGVGDDANLPLLKRAGPAGRLTGARALDRTCRVQAEFVSLQDRTQPDRRIESGRGPGIGSGHRLPATEFHFRRLACFLDWTLPGAEGKRNSSRSMECATPRRSRCRRRPACRAKPSTMPSFRGSGQGRG